MFSKHLKRLLILGVVVVSLVTTAASASAATVTVSPGGPVTGTNGSVNWSFNTARRTVNCSQIAFTATLFSASGMYPVTISNNLQFFCRGSVRILSVNGVLACTATARLNVTGPTVGGVTPISITGISCTFTATGTTCSVRVSGGVVGTFNNAGSLLTINATGQTLAATGSSDGRGGTCALLPNDPSVSWTGTTGAAIVFTVTPATTINAV